jgi:tRNA pseudouridine55 synthase
MPNHRHGLLVIDKPAGITSRAVVNRAMNWFPAGTRIGHTGTLDPLATGVLVLCVGNATRLAEFVQDMDKTYRAGLLFGARSNTNDAYGEIESVANATVPGIAQVQEAVAGFLGEIDQVPPDYSAARVSGRRAYKLARRGKEVKLPSRRVHIDEIKILNYAFPRLDLQIQCGKGTYIRSLVRDLGEQLGCGALVTELQRTRVGPFSAEAGLALEAEASLALSKLLPMAAAVCELPKITLDDADIGRLGKGQSIAILDLTRIANLQPGKSKVSVFDRDLHLMAVAFLDPEQNLLVPSKVFKV